MHTQFAEKSLGRAARSLAVTAAVVAGATLLGACGSSSPSSSSSATSSAPSKPTPTAILNTKRVALAIENSVFRERNIHVKVTCPPVVPQEKGRNFACLARIPHNSSRTPVAVTQQNDKGYVTFKVE
jgi:hypothetical protein